MARQNNLYAEIVEVTSSYLGPAADRFINRQVRAHLNKDPANLRRSDLIKLIDWLKVSMAFLTDDVKMVDTYVKSLQSLIKTKKYSHERR